MWLTAGTQICGVARLLSFSQCWDWFLIWADWLIFWSDPSVPAGRCLVGCFTFVWLNLIIEIIISYQVCTGESQVLPIIPSYWNIKCQFIKDFIFQSIFIRWITKRRCKKNHLQGQTIFFNCFKIFMKPSLSKTDLFSISSFTTRYQVTFTIQLVI